MTRYVALTGLPRSGSTLCCRLVNAADDAVALVEPMDVSMLDAGDAERAAEQVLSYFSESERMLRSSSTAMSVHDGGAVPDNPYGFDRDEKGLRFRTAQASSPIQFTKALSSDGLLLIKHNAAFAALLPALKQSLRVVGLIRNPLAVLCSWQTVPIPPQQGRAPGGEHFDRVLSQTLSAEPDRLCRQLTLLDWFFGRYLDHLDEGDLVRYESIIATGGAHLHDTLGLGAAPSALQERNASRAYHGVYLEQLIDGLLTFEGRWLDFYRQSDILDLAGRLRGLE